MRVLLFLCAFFFVLLVATPAQAQTKAAQPNFIVLEKPHSIGLDSVPPTIFVKSPTRVNSVMKAGTFYLLQYKIVRDADLGSSEELIYDGKTGALKGRMVAYYDMPGKKLMAKYFFLGNNTTWAYGIHYDNQGGVTVELPTQPFTQLSGAQVRAKNSHS